MTQERPVSSSYRSALQPVDGKGYRYGQLFGTGGIGSGIVFVLEGNETLRRDESRFGRLLPSRDYCKLHIVFHYIAELLTGGRRGAESESKSGSMSMTESGINVFPIGRVGQDSAGQRLLGMMDSAGMDLRGVHLDPLEPTMFAVCIQYEDGSGGNVTTSVSASNQVAREDIDQLLSSLPVRVGGVPDIMVALPEVPLTTRVYLLEKGRQRGDFNVASCTSSEISEFCNAGGIAYTDLLAINMDEAAALTGLSTTGADRCNIVQQCVNMLTQIHPGIAVTITDGARGSYGYYAGRTEFVPVLQGEVVQTGGAGDAYLAGVIIGLTCGLPFHKGMSDTFFGQTPLASAMEFGTLLASISLTSPHSLHETIDVPLIKDYVSRFSWSAAWGKLFKE